MILARRKIRRALILTSFFMIVLKKHVNKREKTLHHDFVLFIYMYNVRNKHRTCSIEMKFVLYVYFRRSGILLTRIKVKYSSLEVCTCMIIFNWNYHLWMIKLYLFKNILKLTVDSMSIILNSPFCEWTFIEGSHWIQQKSIVFRLFFKFTTFLSFVFWLICSLIIQIQKYEVGKWKWWIQIVIKNHYRY